MIAFKFNAYVATFSYSYSEYIALTAAVKQIRIYCLLHLVHFAEYSRVVMKNFCIWTREGRARELRTAIAVKHRLCMIEISIALKHHDQRQAGFSRAGLNCIPYAPAQHLTSKKRENSCSVLEQFPAHFSVACTLSKKTVILPWMRFLATAHVTIISKPLNLSELQSVPGGPGFIFI